MKTLISGISIFGIIAFAFSFQLTLSSCEKTITVRDTVTVKDTVFVTDTITQVKGDTVQVSFAPNPNPNEAVVSSLWPGNNATLQELPVYYWTSNGSEVESRSYLKFDFSSIPTNRVIVNARLNLYAVPNPLNGNGMHAHSGNDNAVLIQRITTPWDMGTLSWTSKPTTTTSNQVELPATTDPYKNYENLNVTAIIRDMYQQGNNGMVLRLKNSSLYNIQNFASSKHTNHNLHPKLIVEYSKQ
jgi:hypothetical protein